MDLFEAQNDLDFMRFNACVSKRFWMKLAVSRVVFTQNLQSLIECPPREVEAATVRQALDSVFSQTRRLRGYVLDDQNRLRNHMVIFIDGKPVKDREGLSDAIRPDSEVYVMQALSGG